MKRIFRRREPKKRYIKVLSVLLVIGLIFCAVLEGQIIFGYNYNYEMKNLKKHDTIIILGCQFVNNTPSDLLYERLKKGEQLYKKGYAKYIIVSGGQGSDEKIPEAEGMKRFLIKDGIPKKNVIAEDKSHNTKQNLENSKKLMKKYGFKDAIIVTNKFHVYRSMRLCDDLNIKAVGIAAPMVKGRYDVTLFFYTREILSLTKYYILKAKSYI